MLCEWRERIYTEIAYNILLKQAFVPPTDKNKILRYVSLAVHKVYELLYYQIKKTLIRIIFQYKVVHNILAYKEIATQTSWL